METNWPDEAMFINLGDLAVNAKAKAAGTGVVMAELTQVTVALTTAGDATDDAGPANNK